MKTWVYKGDKKPNAYLYINKKDDFSAVPVVLIKLLGEMQLVVSFDLAEKPTLAQVDKSEVIEHLKNQGYYLQMPSTDFSTQTTPPLSG